MIKKAVSKLLFLISFSLFSCKEEKKHNIHIEKFYYKNNQLKLEITFLDSIKNGLAKEYYENGQLRKKVYYVNDTLNGHGLNYDTTGRISVDGFFWKGETVGPISYYNEGYLTLYNEVDYSQVVYYVRKFDKSLKIIKEEGVAISPNVYSSLLSQNDSIIPINSSFSVHGFYAEPPGLKNTLEGFINDEPALIDILEGHICIIKKELKKPGKYVFRIKSTLKNKDSIVCQNDCYKVIYCR